jgi:hypothetical protein
MPPKSRSERKVASTVTVDSSDDEDLHTHRKKVSSKFNDDVHGILDVLTRGFESMKKSNEDMNQKIIDLSSEFKTLKTDKDKSYSERVESNIPIEDKYKGERKNKMLEYLESKEIEIDEEIERSELIKLCIEHDYIPSKKKEKKVIDPNAPKKPLSTFIMFSNEFRGQFVESYPKHKQSDIAKMLGAEWKELDDEGQEPYKVAYKLAKDAYDIEFAAYQLTLETASVDSVDSVESTSQDGSLKLDFKPPKKEKEPKKVKEPKKEKEPKKVKESKKDKTSKKDKKDKKDKTSKESKESGHARPSPPPEPEPEPEPEPQQDFSSQLNQSIEAGGMTIDSGSDFDAESDSD